MDPHPHIRRAYLLTIWQESGPFRYSPPAWRIRLVDTATSRAYGFSTLQGLLHFLEAQAPLQPEAPAPRENRPDD